MDEKTGDRISRQIAKASERQGEDDAIVVQYQCDRRSCRIVLFTTPILPTTLILGTHQPISQRLTHSAPIQECDRTLEPTTKIEGGGAIACDDPGIV